MIESRLTGMVMDVSKGDTVTLGNNIKIHILSKSGRITRVRIAAPLEIKIRKESSDPRKNGFDASHQA